MSSARKGNFVYSKKAAKIAILILFAFVTLLIINPCSCRSQNTCQSPLYGKKIAFNGDSICEYEGGYAKIIASLTGCIVDNRAVGGGTFTRLCTDVPNMASDADLVCFEGGINDFWGNIPIGTLDKTSSTRFSNTIDTTTLYGALESVFRQSIAKWTGVPICFIIVHKIQNTEVTANANGDTWTDFHNAIVEVCQKYSIPCLDLFLKSGMNCQINDIASRYTINSDGTHPNSDGYNTFYVPQILTLLESLVPR